MTRATTHDGAVNREAEARYPDGSAPRRVVPFALDSYGSLGRTALTLRKSAHAQDQRLEKGADEAAGALTLRWSCRLIVALHKANAEALRTALGKEAPCWKALASELAG